MTFIKNHGLTWHWSDFTHTCGYLIAAFFLTLFLVQFSAQTGPNCPGKDPQWIGYCDSTEAGQ